MTDAEMLRAIYEALPELLAISRRMDEALELLGAPPPARQADPVVTCEEAARMLGVRPDTLRRGLAGTGAIPRHSSRPLLYSVREVERFIRERARRASEAKDVRGRLSLVRRGVSRKSA